VDLVVTETLNQSVPDANSTGTGYINTLSKYGILVRYLYGKRLLKLDMKRKMKPVTIAILYMTEPRLVKLLIYRQR
jgi:hypothetical protein